MLRIVCSLLLFAVGYAQQDPKIVREAPRTSGVVEINGKPVRWVDRGGYAVAGDIIVGTTAEVLGGDAKGEGKQASFRFGAGTRWPNGVVPYTVDAAVRNPQWITQAVAEWNAKTPIRLIPRTNETDFVRFQRLDPNACYSSVGRVGGQQTINIGDGCGLGATIHEIGHAVGLWHEQSRQDRDYYVRVDFSNIDRENAYNFDLEGDRGIDYGHYDFGSIMHYSNAGFNASPAPTLVSIPAGIPIGQRGGLSTFDVASVNFFYGRENQITIDTVPTGLRVIVDGEQITAPRTYSWAEGTEHTISVPDEAQTVTDVRRYVFGRWSDNGSRTHTIRVNRRETPGYVAAFIEQYRLPVNNGAGGRARVVNPSPDGFYTVGEPVTVEAVPDAGFRFVSWTAESAGYFRTLGNAANPHTIPQLATSHAVTPLFTQGPITRIESNERQSSVVVDGTQVALPSQFAWAPGSQHTLEAPAAVSDGVQINGVDNLAFRSWSVGSGGRTAAVTAAGEDTTIRAEFTRSVQVLVQRAGAGLGAVSSNPGSSTGYFEVGTDVTFRATSFTGQFVGWSGDATGADNPLVVRADRQKLITAGFLVPGQLRAAAIVDAATYSANGIAPGMMIALFGLNIGPEQVAGAFAVNGRLLTEINGTQVTIDGVPAPIVYLSANQLNVIVPYAIASKAANRETVRVDVTTPGRGVASAFVSTRPAGPAIFTRNASGVGNCACLNENGTVNSPLNPAAKGSVVVLYATGEGQTVPAGVDGLLAAGATTRPVLPIRARVGSREVPVDYAGAAPGFTAGTMQVNVRIPSDIVGGNVPVQLFAGEEAGLNTVTIAVQQ